MDNFFYFLRTLQIILLYLRSCAAVAVLASRFYTQSNFAQVTRIFLQLILGSVPSFLFLHSLNRTKGLAPNQPCEKLIQMLIGQLHNGLMRRKLVVKNCLIPTITTLNL